MAMAVVRYEGQSYSQINMTPLIDVMLVLLIIFIITLPGMTHAVKIDNPLPPPIPPTTSPKVISLSIDFDGALTWDKRPVDRATLQGFIRHDAKNVPQPEIHITVDKFAKYEIVVQTLADLQRGGLQKIGFVNNDYY